MQLSEAIDNNLAWATKRAEEDPLFFKRLARGQKPSILYIGCSDSRVAAEAMLGAGPGELFLHRNIANLIPNNDAQHPYAVIHFAVKDLGGEECCCMRALRLRWCSRLDGIFRSES